MQKVEWMIAWRYLRTKSGESFVSVIAIFSLLGIALGVATLIIVMSVMKGYEVELVGRILGLNGHIVVSATEHGMDKYEEALHIIKDMPEVRFAAPMVQGQAMATTTHGSLGVMVRGMNPDDLKQKPLIASSLKDGGWESMDIPVFEDGVQQPDKHEYGVIIGNTLAESLHLEVGGQLKLIAADLDTTALGNVPRMKTYKVVGIFDVGMYEYNAGLILMPIAAAQLFFRYKGEVSDIEIVADNLDTIPAIKKKLTRLPEIVGQPLKIVDWMVNNQNLMHALKVERNVMFLILALIIIVAAFNTISGLVMLVKEKTRSIAILRTFGMSRASVIRIFVITGSLIGIIGTILGVALGVVITLNIGSIQHGLESLTGNTLFDPVIYFLTKLPAELQGENVVKIALFAITLSVLATIYPAWRASKLMPAEALRYE